MQTRARVRVSAQVQRFLQGDGSDLAGAAVGAFSLAQLRREFQVRSLSKAPVVVVEHPHQRVDGALAEPFAQHAHRFPGGGALHRGRMRDAIDPSLAVALPAVPPVARVEASVGSELHVGGEDLLDEHLGILDRVARTRGLHAEAPHLAVGVAAEEVADQEGAVELGREARAGIGGEPRRSVGQVRRRGRDPCRLHAILGVEQVPQVLLLLLLPS